MFVLFSFCTISMSGALLKSVSKTQQADTCVAAVYLAARIMGSRFTCFFPIPQTFYFSSDER